MAFTFWPTWRGWPIFSYHFFFLLQPNHLLGLSGVIRGSGSGGGHTARAPSMPMGREGRDAAPVARIAVGLDEWVVTLHRERRMFYRQPICFCQRDSRVGGEKILKNSLFESFKAVYHAHEFISAHPRECFIDQFLEKVGPVFVKFIG